MLSLTWGIESNGYLSERGPCSQFIEKNTYTMSCVPTKEIRLWILKCLRSSFQVKLTGSP